MASTTRLGLQCLRQLRQPVARSLLRPEHIRQSFPVVNRIAPFTTTAQKKILPPSPQVIRTGVNEPAPVPNPHPSDGSYHWIVERVVSVGLIPLTLAPFAAGSLNPLTDAILVSLLLVHSHVGFHTIIVDYIPEWRLPKTRRAFDYLLYLATLVVGIGLYEFETNDVGLTETIKRIWRAGANDSTVKAADISALGHDGKLKHLTN